LIQLKACLAEGDPFVFGFTVYDSFESDVVATTGNMPMPSISSVYDIVRKLNQLFTAVN
jgi:precorrin-6B methylase 1